MVKLNLNVFRDMVYRCKATLATDNTRPILRNIAIKVADRKVTMWGTNGYQINVVEAEIDSDDKFTSAFSDLYIPNGNSEVVLEKVEKMLEITYYPSGLKICLPEANGEPFNVDEYRRERVCNKDFAIAINRQKLEKALKKYGRATSDAKDMLVLRVNTSSSTDEIEILSNTNEIKETSYVLPMRCPNIEEYIDK